MSATVAGIVPKEAEFKSRLQLADGKDSLFWSDQRGQTEALIGALGEERILIIYQVTEGIRLSMSLGRYC